MTSVNTNVKALFAQNALQTNNRTLTSAMQQLSTGTRINGAKDDAAGLAIGTRMTADLRGMSVAIRNANDGISMMQTAEGALGEISNMLQRMRDLSAQSATGSLTSSNRTAIQKEVTQLIAEIDNVAKTTNFNGIKLLDGTAGSVAIQTGVNEGDQVTVGIEAASSRALGLQGFRVEGQLTSGRVGTVSGLAVDDVQINGKDAFAAVAATNTATGLAEAINSNVGQHRVTAAAFNTVKGAAPTASVFAAGDLQINGSDVGAASSVEELVSNINRDVAGVTAVLGGDGTIELSNDTGANIDVAGSAEEKAGFVANAGGTTTYKGFVTLTSMDAADISIKAMSPANGYIGGAGTVADVKALGFNETADSQSFTGSAVSTDKFTISDDLRINGVKVGASNDASATAKAAAINAVSAETGVTASARTEVVVTFNLTSATALAAINSGTDTFSINGKAVTFTSVVSLASAVAKINDAAIPDVLASADSSGRLILSSSTGATISVRNTNTGGATLALATAVASTSGDASAGGGLTAADGANVAGRITLSSSTGSDIRVESAIAGSADKMGFADQGGSDTLVGGALTVTTQASAGRAITAIDAALDQVSMSRADLGAFQNRLTAAVDNLSSQSTNVAEAKGRIMDTDYAKATTELARTQIIQQAATAMLAQANQQPQMVLSLLQ